MLSSLSAPSLPCPFGEGVRPLASWRILVIEDDPAHRQILASALGGQGFEVVLARDGASGLEEAQRHPPDVVVLDWQLPDTDGLEVCRTLRQTWDHWEMGILVVTGLEDTSLETLAFESGVDDFLRKPYSLAELLARLRYVLKNLELYRALKERTERLQEAYRQVQLFQTAVEALREGVVFFSPQGEILYANPTQARWQGCLPEELRGQRWENLYEWPEGMNPSSLLEDFPQGWDGEVKVRTAQESLPCLLILSPIRGRDGNLQAWAAIATDISFLKELEEERIRRSRIETVMETAVALNHEINNALQPIVGLAELMLLQGMGQEAEWQQSLRTILESGQRIAETVRRLAEITHPVSTIYMGKVRMLDLRGSSEQKEKP